MRPRTFHQTRAEYCIPIRAIYQPADYKGWWYVNNLKQIGRQTQYGQGVCALVDAAFIAKYDLKWSKNDSVIVTMQHLVTTIPTIPSFRIPIAIGTSSTRKSTPIEHCEPIGTFKNIVNDNNRQQTILSPPSKDDKNGNKSYQHIVENLIPTHHENPGNSF